MLVYKINRYLRSPDPPGIGLSGDSPAFEEKADFQIFGLKFRNRDAWLRVLKGLGLMALGFGFRI